MGETRQSDNQHPKTRRPNGEGSIRRRSDGRYEGSVRLTLQDGRTVRRSVYGRNRQEVSRKISKTRKENEAGTLVISKGITLGEYLTQWWNMPGLKQSSLKARRVNVNRVNAVLGHLQLQRLTPDDLRKLNRAMADQGLGGYARQQCFAILNRALKDALLEGQIGMNPFERLPSKERPRGEQRQMRVLNLTEISALLGVNDRWRPLWALLIGTGLRTGEAHALSWDDVDLDRCSLRVVRSLQHVDGQLLFVEPKTAHSKRTVKFDSELRDLLIAHRRRQSEERLALGPDWQDSGLVFANHWGGVPTPNSANKALSRSLREAGVRHARIHDLRHTYATLQMEAGVPTKVVSEALGHSKPSTTEAIYQHVSQTMQDDAAAKMNALLAKALGS